MKLTNLILDKGLRFWNLLFTAVMDTGFVSDVKNNLKISQYNFMIA